MCIGLRKWGNRDSIKYIFDLQIDCIAKIYLFGLHIYAEIAIYFYTPLR